MSARLIVALAAIPLTLAAGAFASHRLLPSLDVPSRALEQPLLVVTSWGSSGVWAWLLLCATLLLAGIPYLVAISELRGNEQRDARIAGGIVAAAALSIVAVCSFRFIFSSDIYVYAAYGALAALGEDPYRIHAPFTIPLQTPALTAAVQFEWPSLPTCVYGPVFVWIARETVVLGGGDPARILLAFRLFAAVAFLTAAGLIARFAPSRPLFIAGVVGLNPIALWALAEGHNDALAFAVAASGIMLARKNPRAGGILAGASTLLKLTGGIAAVLAAYPLANRRFTTGALAAIAGSVLFQAAAIAMAGGYQAQVATDFVGTVQAEVAVGIKGMLALIAIGFTVHSITTDARLRALATGTLAIWVVLPHPYAWYGLWLLPLAALTIETSEGMALLAATFCGLLRYLSDAIGSAPAAPWLGLVAGAIPIAVLIAQPLAAWRSRPVPKTLST